MKFINCVHSFLCAEQKNIVDPNKNSKIFFSGKETLTDADVKHIYDKIPEKNYKTKMNITSPLTQNLVL